MAKTPDLPPSSTKPAPTPRTVMAHGSRVVVSKQVFTDFASI